jgi:hypothetical protein
VGLSRPLPSSWPGGRVSARNPPAILSLKGFFFSYQLIFTEKQLLNQIKPDDYNSFVLEKIYGIMQIYLLIVSKNNILKLNERPCSKLQGIRACLLEQFELPEGGLGLTLFLDIALYDIPVGPFANCRNVVAI